MAAGCCCWGAQRSRYAHAGRRVRGVRGHGGVAGARRRACAAVWAPLTPGTAWELGRGGREEAELPAWRAVTPSEAAPKLAVGAASGCRAPAPPVAAALEEVQLRRRQPPRLPSQHTLGRSGRPPQLVGEAAAVAGEGVVAARASWSRRLRPGGARYFRAHPGSPCTLCFTAHRAHALPSLHPSSLAVPLLSHALPHRPPAPGGRSAAGRHGCARHRAQPEAGDPRDPHRCALACSVACRSPARSGLPPPVGLTLTRLLLNPALQAAPWSWSVTWLDRPLSGAAGGGCGGWRAAAQPREQPLAPRDAHQIWCTPHPRLRGRKCVPD